MRKNTKISTISRLSSIMNSTPHHILLYNILHHNEARRAFKEFLDSIDCGQMLEFLDEVEQFRTISDPTELRNEALRIWNHYLSPTANLKVHVDASTLEIINSWILEQPNTNTFDMATDEVYNSLETDCIPKLLSSPDYKELISSKLPCSIANKSDNTAKPLQTVTTNLNRPDMSPLSEQQRLIVERKLSKLQKFFGATLDDVKLLKSQVPSKQRAREIIEKECESPYKRVKRVLPKYTTQHSVIAQNPLAQTITVEYQQRNENMTASWL